MANTNDTLREIAWKELKEQEGITKEDVDMVMLEIAFSPVIPCKNGTPHEVIETIGGKYIIKDWPGGAVDAETLKIMRYRFLTSRDRFDWNLFDKAVNDTIDRFSRLQ